MRLGRMLLIVAVLLIVVVAAVFAVTTFLGGGANDPEAAAAAVEATRVANEVEVVAFFEPVERGEKLTTKNVLTVKIQRDQFREGSYTALDQVIGLYACGDYAADEVVNNTMLVITPQELLACLGSDHAVLIPSGLVAVAVPITRFSGLAWGLTIGDRVNVIATISFVDLDTQFQSVTPNHTAGVIAPGTNLILSIETESGGEGESTVDKNVLFDADELLPYANLVAQSATGGSVAPQGRAELDSVLNQPFYLVPSEDQRPRIVTQTVMFNKIVLHVGDFDLVDDKGQEVVIEEPVVVEEGEEAAAPDAPPPPPPEPVLPDIVTLIVSPQEAVTLNYLIYSGAQLTLALRPPGDDPIIPTDAVTLQYLLDAYRIPVPIKLPYGIDSGLVPPVLQNDIPDPEETP